jgi:hypothetical protein
VWVAPEGVAAHAGRLETGWVLAGEAIAAGSFVDSRPGSLQYAC